MLWLLTLVFTFLPTYLLRFQIGPLPTTVLEILVWITLGVWLVEKIKSKKYSLSLKTSSQKWFTLSSSLFLLGATIGVFVNPNLRAALGEWRAFYLEPFLLALVVIDVVTTREQVHKIFAGLIIGSLTTSLLAIYQHFTGWLVPYSFWANRQTYRVTGWYGFPNGVGLLLAPLIPLAIFVAWNYWSKSRQEKLSWLEKIGFLTTILFIISSLLAIVYAKTTAALVGLVVGVGVTLLCFNRTRLPAIIAGLVGLIGLIVLPNNAVTNELLAKDYSGQLRRDIWTETVTYLKIHPLVGTGVGGYSAAITPFRHNKNIEVFHHPHNIFLTIWVNTGLLGLIGFISLLVWFYWTACAQLKTNRTLALTLIVAMSIWLTMGLVDSPYIKNDWALIFWLIVASNFIKK